MNQKPPLATRLLPWLIWSLAAFFYFYEFLLQVSPSVMVPQLSRAFHADARTLGDLAAFYFYAYAVMQIPVGLLYDRYGVKRILTTAILVCATGTLIFSQSSSLGYAETGRTLIGLGSSFAVVGCLQLATIWFPVRRFALLTGLMLTIGMLGAMGGEAPLALLVNAFGWRQAMTLLAIAGLLLAIIMSLIIRDNPDKTTLKNNPIPNEPLFSGLAFVLKSPQCWLTAIYGGLKFAPTSALGALWGVPFLMARYPSMPSSKAGLLISLIFLGWAIGSPLWGSFSDRIGKRRPPMFIGTTGSLVCILFILYQPVSTSMMAILLFTFGITSSGFLTSFSIMREIVPKRMSGVALGFMNMMNMVGGALSQPLIGALLVAYSTVLTHGHHHHALYSAHDFTRALSCLPVTIALALLLLPFIKETYCRES